MPAKELLIFPITGELTFATVEEVEPRLLILAREGTHLILDLNRLAIMTTPGIGLLLEVHRAATDAGGRLALARLSPHITDLIERTQLHRILSIHPTVDEAVDRLLA